MKLCRHTSASLKNPSNDHTQEWFHVQHFHVNSPLCSTQNFMRHRSSLSTWFAIHRGLCSLLSIPPRLCVIVLRKKKLSHPRYWHAVRVILSYWCYMWASFRYVNSIQTRRSDLYPACVMLVKVPWTWYWCYKGDNFWYMCIMTLKDILV